VDQREASQTQRTDVGVQLGAVQGLDELPETLLVSVHLPVSPDEEFPAHVCGVCRWFSFYNETKRGAQQDVPTTRDSGEGGSDSRYL